MRIGDSERELVIGRADEGVRERFSNNQPAIRNPQFERSLWP